MLRGAAELAPLLERGCCGAKEGSTTAAGEADVTGRSTPCTPAVPAGGDHILCPGWNTASSAGTGRSGRLVSADGAVGAAEAGHETGEIGTHALDWDAAAAAELPNPTEAALKLSEAAGAAGDGPARGPCGVTRGSFAYTSTACRPKSLVARATSACCCR